jgi:hypothetical protein
MIVDSEAELLDTDPKILLEISDQIVNGASDTAPIETPSVKVSRTATALMVHAKGEIRRAVAVLILIRLLGCHS